MAVTLTGEGSALASVESVPTTPINASNDRGRVTYNVSLRPPAGLSTVGSASAVVTLEVRPVRQSPAAPSAAGGETTPPTTAAPRPQPETERPPREEPTTEPGTEPAEKPAPPPSGTTATRRHPAGAGSTSVDEGHLQHKAGPRLPKRPEAGSPTP
jgi:hypothetical protein